MKQRDIVKKLGDVGFAFERHGSKFTECFIVLLISVDDCGRNKKIYTKKNWQ